MRTDRNMRWPKVTGSPVLESIQPVIERSRDVQTHVDRIVEVAGWMAYEELPMPDYALPFGIGGGDVDHAIDFILTAACIDTAFTDFFSQIKFQADYGGRNWSDSDALFACMKRAIDRGVPMLDGAFLAKVTRAEMETLFSVNIELPMLEEKTQIFNQVGAVLAQKYKGRFHNFVRSCSPKLYENNNGNGNGLVDRLVQEFPRFRDVSPYEGHTIKFYKLPQLAIWFLYTSLGKGGQFRLDDLETMSAFADYIVPVALRLLGITGYSAALENAINSHQMIPHDSAWEVEIRAHCIYASALLAEEINQLRPADRQIVIPQIDARLWTHYHTTWWPHHLTKTIMY
ncbi:MAG: queuosine salvage family protein [Terriglobales bacterium]